jgi:pyruvate/2-oxoglutarate dehydrogenase complex dihydrolipoamide acyltransferase (E2) component
LPDLGEKIKEGRVKKLYVKEGDKINEFSKIADVESDKQFTEITSPEEGIIKKIFYHEDTVCQVGDVFLEIETNSDSSK